MNSCVFPNWNGHGSSIFSPSSVVYARLPLAMPTSNDYHPTTEKAELITGKHLFFSVLREIM